jgi:threonine dehydrogenase-like Zn-dependent dehydrogenase
MRAAVLKAPGRMRLEEVPLPQPGPGQVRVRLEGSGICGSNLPPFEGRSWFEYPFAPGSPGHEGWGVVEALGLPVEGVSLGERVALLSTRAFAEYDVTDAQALVRLPASLGGAPFPGEALGCAMNVFRRSAIAPGQDVVVIGIGFLGAAVTRLAARAGARVTAISRRPFALETARRAGASETIALSDDHGLIVERIRALTNGRLCDRVIEAIGAQRPLDLASQLVREGGRLVIAGYHQDGPRTVDLQLWNWRGIDVINAHERDLAVQREGVRLAAEAAATGLLDVPSLATHVFPLEAIEEAFEMARSRPDGFLKAVVTT